MPSASATSSSRTNTILPGLQGRTTIPQAKCLELSYIDTRDLGKIVGLCVAKIGLRFRVFNAVNDEITADRPTAQFLRTWARSTAITRAMEDFGATISNRKIREGLGFNEDHN